jgi:hypothetical protein
MNGAENGVSQDLTSNQKGAIAEAEIACAAIRAGLDVYRPMQEHGRYDLILGIGSRLLRVQCKWAGRRGDVVALRTDSCRRGPGNTFLRRSYSESEIDALAAYCAELDRCYLLPASLIAGKRQIYLRLAPCRNGQRALVHWAEQYRLGAIAQLGERLHGMQEAAGSSPASST